MRGRGGEEIRSALNFFFFLPSREEGALKVFSGFSQAATFTIYFAYSEDIKTNYFKNTENIKGNTKMIIVVAHIKGGTGKTTTSVQLALHRKITHPERKVWLIDTDEQQSALDTITIRSEQAQEPALPCSAYSTGKALLSQLNAQSELWDDIVIDAGGRDTDALRVALLGCDKLIVPVLPRAYDVWSLTRLEEVIESARNLGANFEVFTFINQKDKSADCRDAEEYLKNSEVFNFLETPLTGRIAYSKAGGNGKAVSEMRPRDKRACAEIDALAAEVFK
jgi:chromosome partitioning protein